MAIYHLTVKNISRGDGRSALAAAAYRAGARLCNQAGKVWNFSRRKGVAHAEIMAPEIAPAWMRDRERLWQGVEEAERRKDSRLAKEIQVALPRELSPDQRLTLIRAFASSYVGQGLVADFAIHTDEDDNNPHVHMLLTTREISAEGFGRKIRRLDSENFVLEARQQWAALANAALAAGRQQERIDHRSHAARGITRPPTVHRGRGAEQLQRRGVAVQSRPRQYRSIWGNLRTVDYPTIDTGPRAMACRPSERIREMSTERQQPNTWWESQAQTRSVQGPGQPERARNWWDPPDLTPEEKQEIDEWYHQLDRTRLDPVPDADGRPASPDRREDDLWERSR